MDSSPQQTNDGKKAPTIRDLFPDLTDDQVKEAETNLRRYLEIALDIYKEQCLNPDDNVDISPPSPTMKERSNVSLKK